MGFEEIISVFLKQFGAYGIAVTAMYYWNRRLEQQIERLRNERDEWKERTLEKHQETMDEFQEQGDLMDDLYQELKQRQRKS